MAQCLDVGLARGELLAEGRKHQAVKILRQISLIGPLRAARCWP
jgi:hypothetical protein